MFRAIELFNVNDNTTLAQLKKQYFDFALLAHPDRGGSVEQMQILKSAYEESKNYIMVRLLPMLARPAV